MKTNVTFSLFADAFKAVRPENFTIDGLRALYDYLLELEESSDEEIELDVIALCCDYNEYSDPQDINKVLEELKEDYPSVLDDLGLDDEEAIVERLRQETEVIRIPRGFGYIIRCF